MPTLMSHVIEFQWIYWMHVT